MLTPLDYTSQIRAEALDVISQHDPSIIRRAEAAVVSRLRQTLSVRYEVDAILIPTPEFDVGSTYQAGQQAYFEENGVGAIYQALQATTGHLPADANYWQPGDARLPWLVKLAVDMVLYQLYTLHLPDAVPDHIVAHHQAALEWLDDMAKSEAATELPTLPNDPNNPIKAASGLSGHFYW